MASRESQGLQIALILFVMVTVVLAITTYVYFRKSEEKINEARAARDLEKQAKDAMLKTQDENAILKHVLGYETKTDNEIATLKAAITGNKLMEDVLANYREDMNMYGAGLEKERANYRNLPPRLLDSIQTRNTQLAEMSTQVKTMQTDKERERDDEAKRRVKAEEGLAKANEFYKTALDSYGAARLEFTKTTDSLASNLSKKDTALNALSASAAKEKEEIEKKMAAAKELAASYHEKLEKLKEKPSDTPAGEVKYVDQRSNMVFINLGSADGVDKQMSFSVIDQNDIGKGMTKAKVKGRVQVTRVMEDHLAEARIIDNPINDPILQGDKIFSPSFKKGQKVHFALVGVLDMDGDGKSDQAKIRSIITMNNGVVDAELQEDGSIAGRMNSETRYLVQGQKPTDKTNVKFTEGYTRMIGDAQNLGIEVLTMQRLLDMMGHVPDKRVTDLTKGGAGGASKKVSPSNSSFRTRKPGSAYP